MMTDDDELIGEMTDDDELIGEMTDDDKMVGGKTDDIEMTGEMTLLLMRGVMTWDDDGRGVMTIDDLGREMTGAMELVEVEAGVTLLVLLMLLVL